MAEGSGFRVATALRVLNPGQGSQRTFTYSTPSIVMVTLSFVIAVW